MKIVTIEQMRTIETRSERAGVSTEALMDNAGLAVAERVRHHVGALDGVPIVVLAGPGNNGGDGLVAAAHLRDWGAQVTVFMCLERSQPNPKLEVLEANIGDTVLVWRGDGFRTLENALPEARLILDAILGTGRARPIEGTIKRVLDLLHMTTAMPSGPTLMALDTPTGLDADSGAVDPSAVPADVTVSLGYAKRGHYAHPGADHAGRLEVVDIGIPPDLDEDVDLTLLTSDWSRVALPRRPSDSHKGTFGKTMIVAGSRNYVGAAYLAATAATRVGAGLVTVAMPESLVGAVASKAVEPTYLPLPESSPGVVSPEAAGLVLRNLSGYSALLVGCGLGQAQPTHDLVEQLLLAGADLPSTVVDADGLNALSRVTDWHRRLTSDAILTPHPGEMNRLTGDRTPDDRVRTATLFASGWHSVVVLKGAHTVIAHPDGDAVLSPFANPGLATAGTGDVLAGAIAGLLSQSLSRGDAAKLGVYIHGLAGERVRDDMGDTGMIASDLLPVLPKVIRDLRMGFVASDEGLGPPSQ
tara:strand:+ start:15904 stop:17487 length:1584 start_codon:yes stop_codon:yes gene_type:complete